MVVLHEMGQLDKYYSLHYLVKEWALPLNSWNQIIFSVFCKTSGPFRDILRIKVNQIRIVWLIGIQFVPDFFSLPATNSFNGRDNIKVVKYTSIKLLTVKFVPYLCKEWKQIELVATQLFIKHTEMNNKK